MTTLHIIRSLLELIGVLLAAYAIYRQDDLDKFICQLLDKLHLRRQTEHVGVTVVFTDRDILWVEENTVLFTGRDIFWIEEDNDE